jgi:hypothetical protein
MRCDDVIGGASPRRQPARSTLGNGQALNGVPRSREPPLGNQVQNQVSEDRGKPRWAGSLAHPNSCDAMSESRRPIPRRRDSAGASDRCRSSHTRTLRTRCPNRAVRYRAAGARVGHPACHPRMRGSACGDVRACVQHRYTRRRGASSWSRSSSAGGSQRCRDGTSSSPGFADSSGQLKAPEPALRNEEVGQLATSDCVKGSINW